MVRFRLTLVVAAVFCIAPAAFCAVAVAPAASASLDLDAAGLCRALSKAGGKTSDLLYAACLANAPQAERRARQWVEKFSDKMARRCRADPPPGRKRSAGLVKGCAAIEAIQPRPAAQRRLSQP